MFSLGIIISLLSVVHFGYVSDRVLFEVEIIEKRQIIVTWHFESM